MLMKSANKWDALRAECPSLLSLPVVLLFGKMNEKMKERERAGTHLEAVQIREGEAGCSTEIKNDGRSDVCESNPILFVRRPRPRRLGVVLLPRSVDVVEKYHGERHSQELRRKREAERQISVPLIKHHNSRAGFLFDVDAPLFCSSSDRLLSVLSNGSLWRRK